MALYERVSSKQEFNFCEALDKIEEFSFRPDDDDICGVESCAFGVSETNHWSHAKPNTETGVAWDFIASVTPCFLPGFFEGEFCATSYNIEHVARQVGYDQGGSTVLRPSVLSSPKVVATSFNQFVFGSYSAFISNLPAKRLRPYIGRRLSVTRVWQNFWARETKVLERFCSSTPVRDAPNDSQDTIAAAKLQSRNAWMLLLAASLCRRVLEFEPKECRLGVILLVPLAVPLGLVLVVFQRCILL